MLLQPLLSSPTVAEGEQRNDSSSDTAVLSPSPAVSRPSQPAQSLHTLRLKASELAASRSTDRYNERRQTAKELAAAMPQCANCRNKAKLGCTNHRCHSCCLATNLPCNAHHTDSSANRKRKSDAAPSVTVADRQAMLDTLAADDSIGLVVAGVVDEAVGCGYRVRLLVNGYVCEGLLFDEAYAVTIDTLPNEIPAKHLRSITLDSLPPLQTASRPLFPPASPTYSNPPAAHSKPKARPCGYPKGPRSSYVYYMAAMRARAQGAESKEEKNAIQPEWSTLTAQQRVPYVRLAELDKQRWMREMAEWKTTTTEEGERGGENESVIVEEFAAEDNL